MASFHWEQNLGIRIYTVVRRRGRGACVQRVSRNVWSVAGKMRASLGRWRHRWQSLEDILPRKILLLDHRDSSGLQEVNSWLAFQSIANQIKLVYLHNNQNLPYIFIKNLTSTLPLLQDGHRGKQGASHTKKCSEWPLLSHVVNYFLCGWINCERESPPKHPVKSETKFKFAGRGARAPPSRCWSSSLEVLELLPWGAGALPHSQAGRNREGGKEGHPW